MKTSGQFQKQSALPSQPIPQTTSLFQSRPFRDPNASTTAQPSQAIAPIQMKGYLDSNDRPAWWSTLSFDRPPVAGVQPKLTVGAPNDQYEQEADRVADQVMSMPESAQPVQREAMPEEENKVQPKPLAASITPLVQREEMPEDDQEVHAKAIAPIQREAKLGEEEIQPKSLDPIVQREEVPDGEEQSLHMKAIANSDIQREAMSEDEDEMRMKPLSHNTLQRSSDGSLEAGGAIESRLNSSKGGGEPLSDEVRSFMEPRFGADFSQVRVHTGSEAVQMSRNLNAQAFTHKQDVYFGDGKAPAKDDLTAHELTHVVQQRGTDTVNKQEASSPEAEEEKKRIQELNGNYKQAVTNEDWHTTAILLNAFNEEGIRNRLKKLKSKYGVEGIKSICQFATNDSSVGPQSQLVQISNWFLSSLSPKEPETVPAIGSEGSDDEARQIVHTALDAVGLIPGVGDAADAINVLLYVAEGDWTNAGISTAAMIPFLGAGAIVAKGSLRIGKKVVKNAVKIEKTAVKELEKEGVKKALDAGKGAGGNIPPGRRGGGGPGGSRPPARIKSEVFGRGLEGAENTLKRINEGSYKPPSDLTKEHLLEYKRVIDEASSKGREINKSGVQTKRLEIIKLLLERYFKD